VFNGKVSSFALLTEAKTKSGSILTAVFDLANIPAPRHAALTTELATNPLYHRSTRALTMALMAHSA
jgi:hypothetical protein